MSGAEGTEGTYQQWQQRCLEIQEWERATGRPHLDYATEAGECSTPKCSERFAVGELIGFLESARLCCHCFWAARVRITKAEAR